MKKIKLLTPILGLTAISCGMISLVGCSCNDKGGDDPTPVAEEVSFDGSENENAIVNWNHSGVAIFNGFKLLGDYDINNLKVEAIDISSDDGLTNIVATILPDNSTGFKVQVTGNKITKIGKTNFKLKFSDATTSWSQTLSDQFLILFKADTENISDTGVTVKSLTEQPADYAYTNTATFSGYTTNKPIDGLIIEVINSTSTNDGVSLTAKPVKNVGSDTSFNVKVTAQNITDDTIVNFNLKFTDIHNPLWEGYISTGYSIGYTKNDFWNGHNDEACIIDGNGTPHFCDYLTDRNICGQDNEDITDNEGKIYPRNTFNLSVYINPNITGNYLGSNFLRDCPAFNQPIKIPNRITMIGNYFLQNCSQFNQEIILPNALTTIYPNFLYSCTSFNQPLMLPDSLNLGGQTGLDESVSFLNECSSFNQELIIPASTDKIPEDFLYSCAEFNKPIILPNGLTTINGGFLCYCPSFNQSLDLPNDLSIIESAFLYDCPSFNQPLILPNSLTYVGSYFMNGCDNMTSQIDIQDLEVDVFEATGSECMLSTEESTAPMYAKGIEIIGKHKQEFLEKFPNGANEYIDPWDPSVITLLYRNLI